MNWRGAPWSGAMATHRHAAAAGGALCAMMVLATAGCANSRMADHDATLVIRWQRLVDDSGDTCGRCGDTERSIDKAGRTLAASLRPLGLRVRVVKSQLTDEQFKLAPGESNRIWIGDKSLETVLGAKTAASPCAGVCAGSACRTTLVDGRSHETIPAELIVRAGLHVAADLVQPAAPAGPCCPSGNSPATKPGASREPQTTLHRDGS